jgi:hypothetical protein
MLRQKSKFTKNILRSVFDMQRRNLNPAPTTRADTWKVPSATFPCQTYTVIVKDVNARLETDCTCKAGQALRFCKHQALVLHEFDKDNRHWIALLALQAEEGRVAA